MYCEQNSGTIEITTDLSWNQSWICHLLDGTTCDERAYFRGECPATGTVEITGAIETSWWLMDQVSQEIANQQIPPSTEKYTVKTVQWDNIPWENIYVYDVSWNKILSLIANNDPSLQSFVKLIWNYLIVDYWTSFERTFRIYDITNNSKIFESDYHQWGNIREWLTVANNKINFDYTIWNGSFDEAGNPIPKPNNAPICSNKYNWYTESRTFDLNTKQLTKSWIFTCAFYE